MIRDVTLTVTGGAGFIGSNFLHMLSRNGWAGKVVNVDKMTYAADQRNLAGLSDDGRRLNWYNSSADVADELLYAKEKI